MSDYIDEVCRRFCHRVSKTSSHILMQVMWNSFLR